MQRWFEKTNQILEIDIQQVSDLMSLDFNEVDMLEKGEWQTISPVFGHVLFNLWQKDQQTFAETNGVKEHHEGT